MSRDFSDGIGHACRISLPYFQRHIFPGAIALVGANLQSEIDNRPDDVETLTILSSGNFDSSARYSFNKGLSKLAIETLKLIVVSFVRCPDPQHPPQVALAAPAKRSRRLRPPNKSPASS